jgi:hypothetical protein
MIGARSEEGSPTTPERQMGDTVAYVAKLDLSQQLALERLLFFNGCQSRFMQSIVDAIDQYGVPEIVRESDGLRVRVGMLQGVQSLFAIDPVSRRPLGVAVYVRADQEHVTVLHVGVAEDCCAGGPREGLMLLLRLLREVRATSRRLKGVRRVKVLYGGPRLDATAG